MRLLRYLIALAAGFVAMEALVFVAGFLAARSMPVGFFKYFGRENLEMALALWNSVAFALPMLVIAAVIAGFMVRALKIGNNIGIALFVLGVTVSFATYLLSAALTMMGESSLSSAVWLQFTLYWPQNFWQLSAGPWAGWLGLAVGLYVSTRGARQALRTEA